MCTESSLERSIAVDEMCRANGVKFIRGEVRGVFGSLFCDFGPAFDVHDLDGEEPLTCIVASISNDATPLVTCVDCLLYTSPSPRDATLSRMPSSA